MNSPGLVKLVEIKHTVDSHPLNFNFEKRILKNMVPKRSLPEINSIYSHISANLPQKINSEGKEGETEEENE